MAKTKTPATLTIQKATQQARRQVDRLMPDVMATVESKGSYDLDADIPLIVTTVTFPRNHSARHALGEVLNAFPDRYNVLRVGDSSIVITRTR